MANFKKKSFTYWQAQFNEPYNYTLQDLLIYVFRDTKVRDRLREVDEYIAANRLNLINYNSIYRGFFCANFFQYDKNGIGEIIKEDLDSEELQAGVLKAPPAQDGTDQQFLKGKLYFVCYGNYLIAAQDQHLQVRHLEKYLNSMFCKRAAGFFKERQMVIRRTISRKSRDKIRGARRINISAPLSTDLKTRRSLPPRGRGWDAIKAMTGLSSEHITETYTRGVTKDQDIEVTLSLALKKKRGTRRLSDQIDALANTFRHVGDDTGIHIEVETDSGTLKYDELRLSTRKDVVHINDMPDDQDIFRKMIEWHNSLALQEHI